MINYWILYTIKHFEMKFIKSFLGACKNISDHFTRKLNVLKSFLRGLPDAVKGSIIAGVFTALGAYLGTEPWKKEEQICKELAIKVIENDSNDGVDKATIRFTNLKDQGGSTEADGIYRFTLTQKLNQLTVSVSKYRYEDVTRKINLDSLYILPISIKIKKKPTKIKL